MKKNLNVSFYRNGDSIRHAISFEDWNDAGNRKEGAWCYYNNNIGLGEIYGKLYNWFAVNDPRGLAPEGWHIPSSKEWDTLEFSVIGGKGFSGCALKESGTAHWEGPNKESTNSSGFTALPAGIRNHGKFESLRTSCAFWAGDYRTDDFALGRMITGLQSIVLSGASYKVNGYSIRCIKD